MKIHASKNQRSQDKTSDRAQHQKKKKEVNSNGQKARSLSRERGRERETVSKREMCAALSLPASIILSRKCQVHDNIIHFFSGRPIRRSTCTRTHEWIRMYACVQTSLPLSRRENDSCVVVFFFYLCEIRSNKLSNVLMRDCETVLWFCASVQCILYVLYVRRPNIDERITATENFERIMQHIVSVYLRCAMCANTHYDFFLK